MNGGNKMAFTGIAIFNPIGLGVNKLLKKIIKRDKYISDLPSAVEKVNYVSDLPSAVTPIGDYS